MFTKISLQFFVGATLALLAAGADPELCLPKLGCLKGTTMPGFEADNYEAFLGIPYAKPPVGELRLKNPMPIETWDGVLDASKLKGICVQKNYILKDWPISGEEDCLYLNVYRPADRSADPLPVLFYIHGGGFFSGAPHLFGASYLMDTKQVVLVTIAYRLGPFGFLSTGDDKMPGNFGLKDQNLALKWVKENIGAFGGDPNLVTLFGHSAGGSSVHFHTLHEPSHGLFHRSASYSGSALSPFVKIVDKPLEQAQRVAEKCDIGNAASLSTEELAEKLRSVDVMTLVNSGDALKTWHVFPLTNFGPVVESANSKDAFITYNSVEAQTTGKFAQVPWIMATEPPVGEGAVYALAVSECAEKTAELNSNFDEKLGIMMNLPKESVGDLVQEYMGGVHELNDATMTGFFQMFGDYLMHAFHMSIEYIISKSDTDKNPLYILNFMYAGPHSFAEFIHGGTKRDLGVAHMDDAIYLFDMPMIFPKAFEKDSNDAKFSKRFINILVDFAKTGVLHSPAGIETCTMEKINSAGDKFYCGFLTIMNEGDGFIEMPDNRFSERVVPTWKKLFGF